MKIELLTCLPAVLLSSIVICIFRLFRQKYQLSEKKEAFCLLAVYFLYIIRLCIPAPFPFSKSIPIKGWYYDFCFFLTEARFSLFSRQISCLDIFLLIWGTGAVFCLIHFILQYRRCTQTVKHFVPYSPEQVSSILPSVFRHLGREAACTVQKDTSIAAPVGIGIFHKRVLLPDVSYTDTDLFYILTHELSHFMNGDLLLKFFIQILCCIFWWNPALHFLQRDLAQILEIRCDMTASRHFHAEDALEYMKVIVTVLKTSRPDNCRKGTSVSKAATTLAANSSDGAEQERFRILLADYKIRKHSRLFLAGTAITLLLLTGTCLFSPVPYAEYSLAEMRQNKAPFSDTLDTDKSEIFVEDNTYYININGEQILPLHRYQAEMFITMGVPVRKEN